MARKVNNISLVSSVLLFIFGLLMVLKSESFIKSASIVIGIILIVVGIFPIIDYFRSRKSGLLSIISLVSGIFSLVFGLVFLINEDILMILIPVFVGVWMIINGINKIQLSLDLRDEKEKTWIITFIYSILIIILGVYFIINPVSGADIVMNTIGIIICVYAVFDIIDCILIMIKIKQVTKVVQEVLVENNEKN